MREVRLVPPALTVWAAVLALLLSGPGAAAAVVAVAVGLAAALRQPGQAVLAAALGGSAAGIAWLRVRTARAWEWAGEVTGTVTGMPLRLESGSHLVRVLVPGHPGAVPVFARGIPPGAVPGAVVKVTGAVADSDRPGTSRVVLSGEVEVVAAPRGMAAFAHHVRSTFAEAVERTVAPGARGLIPGMVLGDTSLQTPEEQRFYVDTGLSHLSAVSGSNVAIVTAAAVVAAAALGLGLRGRMAAAGAALVTFAVLVGPEPSVLRASLMGMVALVAVLSSSVAEPLHTLCLAVIALLIVDTNLAVSFGFALSAAATAGIVVLAPLLYRGLAPLRLPDVLTRALAVAIAADAVTVPLVALMAGQVSTVSVAANIAAAPAAAPITVLGLVAVVLSLCPGGLETVVLWGAEPLAWWVYAVARFGAQVPGATVRAGPLTVAVCWGWVLAGLFAGRPRAAAGMAVTVAVAASLV